MSAVIELDAKSVAYILVTHIILKWGPPRSLLSDRGSSFMSAVIREVLRTFDIQQLSASAYHPQTDGKIERVHRTLNNIVAKLVDPKHKNWELPYLFALHAYRTTANAVYGDTPYFLVHRRDCLGFADVAFLPPPSQEMIDSISDAKTRKWFVAWREQLVRNVRHSRERVTELLKDNHLALTQNHKYADKLPREYNLGDVVWVRDTTTVTGQGLTAKWQPKYLPIPFRIVGTVDEGGGAGGLSFTLQPVDKPDDSSATIQRNVDDIKPFYSVIVDDSKVSPETALLRKYVRIPQPVSLPDLPVSGDSHGWNRITSDELPVKKILDHGLWATRGRVPTPRFRVRFLGSHGEFDAWVDEEDMRCPDLLREYLEKHPEFHDVEKYMREYPNRRVTRSHAAAVRDKKVPARAAPEADPPLRRSQRKRTPNVCRVCRISH